MDFDVLPGPSLPELARTALARAGSATVGCPGDPGDPAPAGQVPVRAGLDGSPLLLPATGSGLEHRLAACPDPVTVTVPATPPYRALRFTGTARPVARDPAAGISACVLDLRSVEFTGATCARILVGDYQAAAPDPLWRMAPGVLCHLRHRHMADLVGCARAHGMTRAEWVIPRGLDRYGLEFLVLTPDGAAAVRLSFPDGPVSSLHEVPASIRAVLTCRCQSGPGHSRLRSAASE